MFFYTQAAADLEEEYCKSIDDFRDDLPYEDDDALWDEDEPWIDDGEEYEE